MVEWWWLLVLGIPLALLAFGLLVAAEFRYGHRLHEDVAREYADNALGQTEMLLARDRYQGDPEAVTVAAVVRGARARIREIPS